MMLRISNRRERDRSSSQNHTDKACTPLQTESQQDIVNQITT